MPLTISDEQLKSLGLDEHQALIEIACRLFEGGKAELWPAAQLAGLSRAEMEAELNKRKIAIYKPSAQDLADDLATLGAIEAKREHRHQ